MTLCGATSQAITCTIQEVRLANHPPYQALSYVWGPPTTPRHALVQDEDGALLSCIKIGTALYHALHDLWRANELEQKVFWIDQICIDQGTANEKGHQVGLMGRIYKNASRVITYLGPAEDEELEGMGIKLLHQVYSHFAPDYEKFEQLAYISGTITPRSQLPMQKLPDALIKATDEKTWAWLATLAFGEFATRLWMVQEQLLNAKIVMLRSPRLLSWNMVAILGLLYYLDLIPRKHAHEFWRSDPGAGQSDPWAFTISFYSLWKLRKEALRDPGAATAPPLLRNLESYLHLRCQDPRDRIFALLAISGDADILGITPDYNQPASQVFHQTSVAILKKGINLKILALASWCDNLSSPTCPSWVL